MSVIELDGLKNFNNVREIKLPGIENTWKIKFDDNYRVQSSLIATQVDKLYQEQSSDDYEDEFEPEDESRFDDFGEDER